MSELFTSRSSHVFSHVTTHKSLLRPVPSNVQAWKNWGRAGIFFFFFFILRNFRPTSRSLQNRRDFLRISGEQRQKRGEREAPVACEGRIARASRLPRFRLCSPEYAKKNTPVLQAKPHEVDPEFWNEISEIVSSIRSPTQNFRLLGRVESAPCSQSILAVLAGGALEEGNGSSSDKRFDWLDFYMTLTFVSANILNFQLPEGLLLADLIEQLRSTGVPLSFTLLCFGEGLPFE